MIEPWSNWTAEALAKIQHTPHGTGLCLCYRSGETMDPNESEKPKMTTRCKFTCTEVTKRTGWNKEMPFLWSATFIPVTSGSDENKAFFAATPHGKLEVGTVKSDLFEVGKEYYLDISAA